MLSFWKRSRGFDLEGELRAARPEPRPEFLHMVSERIGERRKSYRRVRVSFASAVALGVLVAVASIGGIGYAASSAGHWVKAATAIVKPHKPRVVHGSAASNQYPSARIKVCRKGRVVSIPKGTARKGDRKVKSSARVGSRCSFKPRRRTAPAFTG